MTEILSDEKQILCQLAWEVCQVMMKEAALLFREPEVFAIDLQSLIPPLQKLRAVLSGEVFFQSLCQACVMGEQILSAQKSNDVLKPVDFSALQSAFQRMSHLIKSSVSERTWLDSEVAQMVMDFKNAAEALKVEIRVAAPPAPASVINPKLVDIFFEEADELQISLQEALTAWQLTPEATEHRSQMKRDLHTLKGAARTVGLSDFGTFVHTLENVITALEDNKLILNAAVFQLLQEGLDFSACQMDNVRANKPFGSAEALLNKIQTMLGASAEGAVVPSAIPVIAPVQEAVTEHKNTPIVRVNAQLIEKFSQLAGVANISRANIEEEVGEMSVYVRSVVEVVAHLQGQMKEWAKERAEIAMASSSVKTLKEMTDELQLLNQGMHATLEHTEGWLVEQQRATDALQSGLTSIRMEPFSTVVPRLERLVRQVSSELHKEVDFNIEGQEKECDRRMLESLVPPLEHMIRNAIDHGLESSEDRIKAGKAVRGQITLSLMQTGSELILILKDDGHGIDTQKVRQKAEKMGWITPEAVVEEETLLYLILKPGFSTSEQITQISGRGVGMDVVSTGVTDLGGAFSIESRLGKGALFKIVLPFTLSLNRVLLFQVQREWYGIQLANIEGVVRIPHKDCQRYFVDQEPFIYAEKTYPIVYLATRLGLTADIPNIDILPILLLRLGDKRLAVLVDTLVGTREVVIQAVGPQLRSVHSINGAAILGDGKVVFVLDCAQLVRGAPAPVGGVDVPPIQPVKHPFILVVDDSPTIRQMAELFLTEHHYGVDTAQDGRDGLTKMKKCPPDLVLLDLEMPHMDGYEVISYMRALPTLKDIPIIVISSRDAPEHQQHALQLGANHFLSKPYQEDLLLATINCLLTQPKEF